MNEAVQALRDAADALEQKNVRIAELEAALKPFADFAEKLDAKLAAKPMRSLGDNFYGIHIGTDFEAELTLTDLRRARAALAAYEANRAEDVVIVGNGALVARIAELEEALEKIKDEGSGFAVLIATNALKPESPDKA